MNYKLDIINKLKNYAGLWPIMTFFIMLLGYIGFYTYCSIEKIPFPIPDISLVAGIGIYNFLAVLLMYSPKKRIKSPTLMDAILISAILNYLSLNPILLASLVLIYIQFNVWQFDMPYKKKKSFKELRSFLRKKWRLKTYLYILIFTMIILMTLYIDNNILITIITVYFISKLFYHFKKKKNYFAILIVCLSIPIFTVQNHLNNINYTILGLSKQYSKVLTKKGAAYKGCISFKSSNNLYLRIDDDENIIIPMSQVQEIKTIDTIIKPKKGIDYFKKLIE